MKFLHLYIFAITFTAVWSAPKKNLEGSTTTKPKSLSTEVTESDASAPKISKHAGGLISGAVQKINDLASGLSIVVSSNGNADIRKPYPVCTENDFYQNGYPRHRYFNTPKVLTLHTLVSHMATPFSNIFKWNNDDKVPVYNCIFISDERPVVAGISGYGGGGGEVISGSSGVISESAFSGVQGASGLASAPGLIDAASFTGAPVVHGVGSDLSSITTPIPAFLLGYNEHNDNDGSEFHYTTFPSYTLIPHYSLPVARPSDFIHSPNYPVYPYQTTSPFNYYHPHTANPVRHGNGGSGFYYSTGTQFGFGPKYGASHSTHLWGKRNINDDDDDDKIKQNDASNNNYK